MRCVISAFFVPISRLHIPDLQPREISLRLLRMSRNEVNVSRSSRRTERRLVSGNCFARIRKWSGRERSAVAYVLLAGFLSAICLAGDITVPAPPKKAQATEIPFSLRQGYMIVVEGKVADLDRLNLVIDTGTNPSMIDKSISDRLNLKGIQRGLSLFNKDLSSETVMLPDLELGPLHRVNLPVMVADFSKIGKGLGIRVDGVVGLDVLGATSFTIDYQRNRLSFHASQERHSAPFAAGPQFISVNLKTAGSWAAKTWVRKGCRLWQARREENQFTTV